MVLKNYNRTEVISNVDVNKNNAERQFPQQTVLIGHIATALKLFWMEERARCKRAM